MTGKPKVYTYKTMPKLVTRLRDDFKNGSDFVLLFAYNGTGKTRLSMAFKDAGKKMVTKRLELDGKPLSLNGEALALTNVVSDTLYFNAFTEDLFSWDNDLAGDSQRVMRINSTSRFFAGLKELALEEKIFPYLERYADFDFKIDYTAWTVSFSRSVTFDHKTQTVDNIKVSRGEENIFIWCLFLALAELAIDGAQAYDWVKYLYIDDPVSSLDDNNTIAVASDLAKLLRRAKDRGQSPIKTVVSSHHGLFFNVMHNELRKHQTKTYFLHKAANGEGHTLRATTDTPFFHHVAMLSELQVAAQTGALYTHHFNMLRSILEKTATFFGHKDFSDCLGTTGDEGLHARALNLLSHGKYSLYEPREMVEDNKALFKEVLSGFLARYAFALPQFDAPSVQPPNAIAP